MFGITSLSARLAILGIVSAILFGAGYYTCYHISYLPERDAHTKFVAQVEQIGKDQIKQNLAKEAADKLKKENADEQQKVMATELASLSKQLYDRRSSRSYLPEASTSAKRADRITFDRAKLDAAIRQLDAGVSGLLAEGDVCRLGLNICKEFVKDR